MHLCDSEFYIVDVIGIDFEVIRVDFRLNPLLGLLFRRGLDCPAGAAMEGVIDVKPSHPYTRMGIRTNESPSVPPLISVGEPLSASAIVTSPAGRAPRSSLR
ncbi:hypothetical protein SHLA_4c001060 [Shinella sp. DD12]|nr:hypothetical protein SHLA_4c001060 [Shinella sp. DD12]